MKKIVLLIAICYAAITTAQEVKLLKNDLTSFPKIRTDVSIMDYSGVIKEQDFKIVENGAVIPFSFVSLDSTNKANSATSKAIYFLIESSYATSGPTMKEIKAGLQMAIESLEPNIYVNVASCKGRGTAALKPIVDTFSKDKTIFSDLITKNILQSGDSVSDITGASIAAIEYLSKATNLPADRYIVLLTTGNYARSSDFSIDDVITKASAASIPVYSLTLNVGKNKNNVQFDPFNIKKISDRTTGINRTVISSIDIETSIEEFFRSRESLIEKKPEYKYQLEYTTKAAKDGQEHEVELQFLSSRSINAFITPGGNIINNSDLVFWGALAAISALLLTIFFFLFRRGKNKKNTTNVAAAAVPVANQVKPTKNDTAFQAIPVPIKQQTTAPKVPEIIVNAIPQVSVTIGGRSVNYPINKAETSIGRESSCDIWIDDSLVSRKHAVIYLVEDSVVVSDLSSTNGTFINDKKITQQTINKLDTIKIGKAIIRLA